MGFATYDVAARLSRAGDAGRRPMGRRHDPADRLPAPSRHVFSRPRRLEDRKPLSRLAGRAHPASRSHPCSRMALRRVHEAALADRRRRYCRRVRCRCSRRRCARIAGGSPRAIPIGPGSSPCCTTGRPGSDNSPAWDEAFARVPTTTTTAIRRKDTGHVDAAMRPRDIDYQRYIHLVDTLRGRRLGTGAAMDGRAVQDRRDPDDRHPRARDGGPDRAQLQPRHAGRARRTARHARAPASPACSGNGGSSSAASCRAISSRAAISRRRRRPASCRCSRSISTLDQKRASRRRADALARRRRAVALPDGAAIRPPRSRPSAIGAGRSGRSSTGCSSTASSATASPTSRGACGRMPSCHRGDRFRRIFRPDDGRRLRRAAFSWTAAAYLHLSRQP